MSSSAQLGEEGRGFSSRKVAGAGSQVLPAGVTHSCCSARPAPTVPWQPGCQGTQVAAELQGMVRSTEVGRTRKAEGWRRLWENGCGWAKRTIFFLNLGEVL